MRPRTSLHLTWLELASAVEKLAEAESMIPPTHTIERDLIASTRKQAKRAQRMVKEAWKELPH